MQKLSAHGKPVHMPDWLVGVVTCQHDPGERSGKILLLTESMLSQIARGGLTGYKAVITCLKPESLADLLDGEQTPLIHSVSSLDHIQSGYIVNLTRHTGMVRTLYRPESSHNVLFITDRCNSNCLMCSQPPIDRWDDGKVNLNLELLSAICPSPPVLGITGGEPTLLGDGLWRILAYLKEHHHETHIHMLTNGRSFAWRENVERLVAVAPPSLRLGIPLYSNIAPEHDHVVQVRGAFEQTVLGLHQLARYNVSLEVRVVIHRLTANRLTGIADFIYRNLTFVDHVALMGLEMMGYTPKNLADLWIDPFDYQDELEACVEALHLRGMRVSIYNHQLCLLPRSLWPFARRSISDYKNIYLDKCSRCSVQGQCGGLFKSALHRHSSYIEPLEV